MTAFCKKCEAKGGKWKDSVWIECKSCDGTGITQWTDPAFSR